MRKRVFVWLYLRLHIYIVNRRICMRPCLYRCVRLCLWTCEYVVRVRDSTCGRWGMNCAAKEVMIALHSLAVRQWRCEPNALPLSTPLVIHSANQQCRFRVAVERLLDVPLLTCAGKFRSMFTMRIREQRCPKWTSRSAHVPSCWFGKQSPARHLPAGCASAWSP